MKKHFVVFTCLSVAASAFASSSWCYDKWVEMNGGTSATLERVWGNSSDDIYAVGLDGATLHYDGSRWTSLGGGSKERFCGVWGSSKNDVWVVGGLWYYEGCIVHYDGRMWSQMGVFDRLLCDVWGASSDNVFAVGCSGTIVHYDGSEWSLMDGGVSVDLNAVWGSSASNVFAFGDDGTILHYDGTGWTSMASHTDEDMLGADGTSATDVYATARKGIVLHFDGRAWSTIDQNVSSFLEGVWCRTARDVYFGGYSKVYNYHRDAWNTSLSHYAILEDLGGVDGDCFAVGENGTILHLIRDYDLQLEDSNGDRFFLRRVDSGLASNQFYRGRWVSSGGESDCMLNYNIANDSFEIVTDSMSGVFLNVSPRYYEGYYKFVDASISSVQAHVRVKQGSFPSSMLGKVGARSVATPQQENVLTLGALLPMTGELQSLGDAYSAAFRLAQNDAQTYLDEIGSDLSVELLVEDNQSNPGQTWHAVQRLREEGVSVFLGPQDSPSLDYIKQFADEEDYLTLSSACTAAALSIPNDNVMRCISDDNLQAAALIGRMKADGIEDIVIVSRTNIYGEGLYEALERGWRDPLDADYDPFEEESVDRTVAVTVPFSRPTIDIPDALQDLQNIFNEEAFADKSASAVVLIAYDEGAELMEQAAQIEGLDAVRWYGTDSLAQSNAFTGNAAANEFAAKTQFTCTTFAVPESEAYAEAFEAVAADLGYEPPTMAMLVYDAYQLAVRAYLEAGTDDPAIMKEALRNVAQTYQGISGDLTFNENGDRANGAYEYWTLVEDGGLYYWQSEEGRVWTGEPVMVSDWMMME